MLTKQEHSQIIESLKKMEHVALNNHEALKNRIDELAEFTFGRKPGETDKPRKCLPGTIYNAATTQLDKLFRQLSVTLEISFSASNERMKMYDVPYTFVVVDEVFGNSVAVFDPANTLGKGAEQGHAKPDETKIEVEALSA